VHGCAWQQAAAQGVQCSHERCTTLKGVKACID